CSAWSTNGYASRAVTSSEIEATCRPFIWPGSHLVHRALAEESVRPEDEHQDQDREDDGVGPPRGDVLVAPRRQEPYDQAAEGGSRHVADAAEHGGGERPETGLVPHVPLADVVVHPLDNAGRPRQRPADEERQDDRLLDVDSHRLGGLSV